MDNNLFINREISWLEFNTRVLDESINSDNPILERLKFLAISNSNLDEFFNVRVGSLKDMVNAEYTKKDPSGLTPKKQLKEISTIVHELSSKMYKTYQEILIPELKKINIEILSINETDEAEKSYLKQYFNEMIFPILTPHAVDSSRPFPLIQDKSLNIGIFLKKFNSKQDRFFATVKIPTVLPRVILLPNREEEFRIVLLEDIILEYIEDLFQGHKIEEAFPYRVIRNADLTIEEEEAEDLLSEIENSIKLRKWGQAVKLEVFSDISDEMAVFLGEKLSIHKRDIYYLDGPLDFSFLNCIYSMEELDEYKYPKFSPQLNPQFKKNNIFSLIKEKDILLHHPFDSFSPVIDFISKAATDPKVLAIKQTLYRVSGNSPVINALAKAAENGKQVTVLVELKARFDEENNIIWAKRLEKAGCHVIYGLVGLKTHSKLTLILRKENNRIKRYVHMATGNYNDITAKFYTDIGFFTANEVFGQDASKIFNMLSGYSEIQSLEKIVIAPISLREKFSSLIEREISNAEAGKESKIIVKVNSLLDSKIISLLYKASQAGVEIYLIVRGICGIRPQLKGISDNITVKSIVGRFLEHSRIFYFFNDSSEEYYLSSADWMPRNIDKRVETLFPIEDIKLKDELKEILDMNMKDNDKGRLMQDDGKYILDKEGMPRINSQEYFMKKALSKYSKKKPSKSTTFKPRKSVEF